VEGGWSASHTGCFISGERALDTHSIIAWVNHRTHLDTVAKEKKSSSCSFREWNSSYPAHGPVTLLDELQQFIAIFRTPVVNRACAFFFGLGLNFPSFLHNDRYEDSKFYEVLSGYQPGQIVER
jgi:hypothetical protein